MMLVSIRLLLITTVLIFGTYTSQVTARGLPSSVDGQALPSLSPMLQRVTPSVVNIATKGTQRLNDNVLRDPFFKRFFGDNFPKEQAIDGTGSGVIIHASQGHILTNFHVIEGAETILVTLHDGQRIEARVIGTDPRSDLAIIAIQANNLRQVRFGNSDSLRVGDFVVAIGNPYGIGQSVTSGIVSALHRNPGIGEYENYIQTDAPINLGNSGGPLVNLRGELIGINTAILGGQSGGNIGIGFAIPVNTIKGIIEQIARFGRVERGELGLEVRNLNPQEAQRARIQLNEGAVVERSFPGSNAYRAGLRAGDIITRMNGTQIVGASSVKNIIGSLRIGARIQLSYLRNGQMLHTTTQIGKPEVTAGRYIPSPTPHNVNSANGVINGAHVPSSQERVVPPAPYSHSQPAPVQTPIWEERDLNIF